MPMICSSVNLVRFIIRPLSWAGLQSKLEEIRSGRSQPRYGPVRIGFSVDDKGSAQCATSPVTGP